MTDLERKLLDKLRFWVVMHPEEVWSGPETCILCCYGPTPFSCSGIRSKIWANESLTILKKNGRSKAKENYICCRWILGKND
jgi:hypothetical protein